MKKVYGFLGMVAIMAAVVGCDLGDGDSPFSKLPETEKTVEESAGDLADALGEGVTVDPENKAKVNVAGEVTLPAGKAVTVDKGVTLAIPAAAKLTLGDTSLTVEGTLDIAAGGELAIPAGTRLDVAGELALTGAITAAAAAPSKNIVIAEGPSYDVIVKDKPTTGTYTVTKGKLAITPAASGISYTAADTSSVTVTKGVIAQVDTLVIGKDAALTIPADAVLTLAGKLSVAGTVNVDGAISAGASIVQAAGSKFVYSSTANKGVAGVYFNGTDPQYSIGAGALFTEIAGTSDPANRRGWKHEISGGTVTLKKNAYYGKDEGAIELTIKGGATLVVGTDKTLGIRTDGVIKVGGTVNVEKTSTLYLRKDGVIKVEKDGIVNVDGTLYLGQTLESSSDHINTAESYLKGTINVSGLMEDATLWKAGTTEAGGTSAAFWNGSEYYANQSTGSFVIKSGARALVHGGNIADLFSLDAQASLTVRAAANTLPSFEISGGTVTLNASYTLTDVESLLVNEGATLNIVKNATLEVAGLLDGSRATGKFDGTVKVTGTGTLKTSNQFGTVNGATGSIVAYGTDAQVFNVTMSASNPIIGKEGALKLDDSEATITIRDPSNEAATFEIGGNATVQGNLALIPGQTARIAEGGVVTIATTGTISGQWTDNPDELPKIVNIGTLTYGDSETLVILRNNGDDAESTITSHRTFVLQDTSLTKGFGTTWKSTGEEAS